MSDVAIKIENVGKRYTVGKSKDSSLRGSLGGMLKSAASKGEDFWALKDVSFEVGKGEVIGIIGKNGAGKSTLLKILSQITKPTEGRIELNGRVASLLEVGTGFHPELTGRENVYLNGTILGMSRKEVSNKFDEIIEFSGVAKFIDTPVKHYSSGMYVRLAFAVAAHLEPEILIIDEVLAVGDAEFQKKCLGKMKDVAEHGRTVIFVSHNMPSVQNLCSRCIVLSEGNVEFEGGVNLAIDKYLGLSKSSAIINQLDSKFKVEEISMYGSSGQQIEFAIMGNPLTLSLSYNSVIDIPKLIIRMIIRDSSGAPLTVLNNFHSSHPFSIKKGNGIISCEVKKLAIFEGKYIMSLQALNLENMEIFFDEDYFYEFEVESGDFYNSGKIPETVDRGSFLLENKWVHKE